MDEVEHFVRQRVAEDIGLLDADVLQLVVGDEALRRSDERFVGVDAEDASAFADALAERAQHAHRPAADVDALPSRLDRNLVEQGRGVFFPHLCLQAEHR